MSAKPPSPRPALDALWQRELAEAVASGVMRSVEILVGPRACAVCAAEDGRVYPLAFVVAHPLPPHRGCRCTPLVDGAGICAYAYLFSADEPGETAPC